MLHYLTIPVTAFQQNCSLVWCDQTMEAALIDPGGDIDTLKAEVQRLGVRLTALWLTHAHIDHAGGTGTLARELSLPIIGPHPGDQFWIDALPQQSDRFGFPQAEPFNPRAGWPMAIYRKNGKNYETHTPNVLYERLKTPLSQFEKKFSDPVTGEERVTDLNNVNDIIAYKGPTTDFSKAFKTAAGTWMKRGNPIEEDTDGGLSRKVTTYKGYNSPAQFAGSLYEQVNVSTRSKRDFEEKHNYSDEEAANILDRYEQLINSPQIKNAYPDSEEIPAKLFQTKLGRAIALSTMKYMTYNRPQAEFKTERNLDAIMDRKWKEKLDLRQYYFTIWGSFCISRKINDRSLDCVHDR